MFIAVFVSGSVASYQSTMLVVWLWPPGLLHSMNFVVPVNDSVNLQTTFSDLRIALSGMCVDLFVESSMPTATVVFSSVPLTAESPALSQWLIVGLFVPPRRNLRRNPVRLLARNVLLKPLIPMVAWSVWCKRFSRLVSANVVRWMSKSVD